LATRPGTSVKMRSANASFVRRGLRAIDGGLARTAFLLAVPASARTITGVSSLLSGCTDERNFSAGRVQP
jgi:hypothetical protein